MTQLLPGGKVPIIGEKRHPHIRDVETPKVSEVHLRPGYFLARPLLTPERSAIAGVRSFEGERWLVLKSEPDERPEMAWSKGIKPGTVVTMSGPAHTIPMRVDLSDTINLGEFNRIGDLDANGRIVGDAILLVHAQIVAWDYRKTMANEHQGVSIKVGAAAAEHAENERIDQGLHE